mgnify:CR=1 FL=1
MTFSSFGKAIVSLKTLMKEKELIPVDVYPDGNCQFASVVDQLRVHGIFIYSAHTLRLAAVDYLRKHPYAVRFVS